MAPPEPAEGAGRGWGAWQEPWGRLRVGVRLVQEQFCYFQSVNATLHNSSENQHQLNNKVQYRLNLAQQKKPAPMRPQARYLKKQRRRAGKACVTGGSAGGQGGQEEKRLWSALLSPCLVRFLLGLCSAGSQERGRHVSGQGHTAFGAPGLIWMGKIR